MTAAETAGVNTTPTVYLHIGTVKSGTSFLQSVLARHREELAARGVFFPGMRGGEQVEAVRDVLNQQRRRRRRVSEGAWDAMRDRLVGWSGPTSVFSMELLSLANADNVARVVDSLNPAEVHVIITARDLARVIPSGWQESVQNRQTWTWEEYVAGLTGAAGDESRSGNRFWHQHDLPVIAARWAEHVGTDRVHLVIVPPSGAPRDELWRRFADVIGIDAVDFPISPNTRGNPSIGAASAEFLRRVNLLLGKGFDVDAYELFVKKHVAKDTLSYREGEARLHLPVEQDEWVRRRADEMVSAIRALDLDIRGDLDELLPPPAPTDRQPVRIAEHDVAEAGVQAVETLVRMLADASTPDARPRRRRRPNVG